MPTSLFVTQEFLGLSIFFVVCVFLLLCIGLFRRTHRIWLMIVIPLLLFIGTTSYFSITNLVGQPNRDLSHLETEFLYMYHYLDKNRDRLYLVVKIKDEDRPRLFEVSDPETAKKMDKELTKKLEDGDSVIVGVLVPGDSLLGDRLSPGDPMFEFVIPDSSRKE